MKRIIALTLILTLAFCLFGCKAETYSPENDAFTITGRYIEGKTDHIIDCDNHGPIVMSTKDKEILSTLEEFENGDLIEITCCAIEESYPARTEIFSVKLIEKGDFTDINSDTYTQLKDMGWVD